MEAYRPKLGHLHEYHIKAAPYTINNFILITRVNPPNYLIKLSVPSTTIYFHIFLEYYLTNIHGGIITLININNENVCAK